jgi:hypothetical protein
MTHQQYKVWTTVYNIQILLEFVHILQVHNN